MILILIIILRIIYQVIVVNKFKIQQFCQIQFMNIQELRKLLKNDIMDSYEWNNIAKQSDNNNKMIEKLHKKQKSEQEFKINLGDKFKEIQLKIQILQKNHSRNTSKNSEQFQSNLENSQLFKQNLIKIQKNLINNFKLLQDTLNGNLEQMNQKVCTMEDSILGILKNQEKVILKLNTNQQILSKNVKLLEENIEGISKNDNTSLLQSNIKLKIENQNKIFNQRINQIQMNSYQIQNKFHKEIKEFKDKKLNDFAENNSYNNIEIQSLTKKIGLLEEKYTKYHTQINSIQQQITQLREEIQETKTKQKSEIKKILNELKLIKQSTENQFVKIKSEISQINSNKYLMSSTQNKKNFEKARIFSDNQLLSEQLISTNNKNNKKIPSQKSSEFNHNRYDNQPQIIPQVEGGIRGLLKRSKQKQKKQPISPWQNKKPSPLATKKKQLPPLQKQDKFTNKHRNQRNYPESESQQQVYGIDQDGYLINQDGQQVLDDYGNPIQYTPEQIEQLQRQNMLQN